MHQGLKYRSDFLTSPTKLKNTIINNSTIQPDNLNDEDFYQNERF